MGSSKQTEQNIPVSKNVCRCTHTHSSVSARNPGTACLIVFVLYLAQDNLKRCIKWTVLAVLS